MFKMAKLKNFLYCAGTRNEVRKSGEPPVTVVDGLLNALIPDFIPGNYSFSVVFSVLDLQPGKDYAIRLTFLNDKGEEIVKTDNEMLESNPENVFDIPNEYFGYNVCIDLRNVLLEREGEYRAKVYINEKEEGEYPIYIKGKKVLSND